MQADRFVPAWLPASVYLNVIFSSTLYPSGVQYSRQCALHGCYGDRSIVWHASGLSSHYLFENKPLCLMCKPLMHAMCFKKITYIWHAPSKCCCYSATTASLYCCVCCTTLMQDQQLLFAAMSAAGIPRRYTHCLASFMPEDEWQYADRLANMAAGAHGGIAATRFASDHHQGAAHIDQQQHQGVLKAGGCSAASLCTCQQPEQGYVQRGDQSALDGSRRPGKHQEGGVQLGITHLLTMPDWLKELGKAVGGSILGRPETFR